MRVALHTVYRASVAAVAAGAVLGLVSLADAASGFIDVTLGLPAPDGVRTIRTFDYRPDAAALVTGAGVAMGTFVRGTIPVGTAITAYYQSDVGIFENAAGATVATHVGNSGSYEITAVATLTGTVILSGPSTLGVLLTGGSARMYLQNPGDRILLAGKGYQDGSLILAASGTAGSAIVFAGSGGASADFSSIDLCNASIILNCGAITDFHFSSTLIAPPTSGAKGTTDFFNSPPACTGGAFCYAHVAVPAGGLLFDADAFGRATGRVPGPATLWLLGSALLGAAAAARIRRGTRRPAAASLRRKLGAR